MKFKYNLLFKSGKIVHYEVEQPETDMIENHEIICEAFTEERNGTLILVVGKKHIIVRIGDLAMVEIDEIE